MIVGEDVGVDVKVNVNLNVNVQKWNGLWHCAQSKLLAR